MERSGAWFTLPGGYTARYADCGSEVYWHLYYRGERVNGGLCEDFEWAQIRAVRYAWLHQLNVEGAIPERELLMQLVDRSLERHA